MLGTAGINSTLIANLPWSDMAIDLDKLRSNVTRVLKGLSHLSTPFILTFLLVHLAAPASATFGGSSLASQTMLLGREYYQTRISEPFLVLTPLTLHALSGLLQRLVSPKSRPSRPITRMLSITGYATIFLFLPVHFLTHRGYPMTTSPPISGVGPAELDYEFVKTGLKNWPVRTSLLYGGLVLSTALHIADGLQIIWKSWLNGIFGLRAWKVPGRLARTILTLGVFALPPVLGLVVLSKEPLMTFSSMIERYRAVYRCSYVYRF